MKTQDPWRRPNLASRVGLSEAGLVFACTMAAQLILGAGRIGLATGWRVVLISAAAARVARVQQRRSMRLLATGEFEASEQQKLATIQRAEGDREAAIRKAEGERVASIKIAEGRAEAIRLVNEAANTYFQGNAQLLRQMEMAENSLKNNSKIVLTEHGISPTLVLGSLPITQTQE